MVTNEVNSTRKAFIGILVLGLIGVLFLIVIGNVSNVFDGTEGTQDSGSESIFVTGSNTNTLNTGITSLSATKLNQTWLEFDGVDDNIDPEDITWNGSFTFSFWAKHLEDTSTYNYILESRQGVNKWFLSLNNNGVRFGVYNLTDGTLHNNDDSFSTYDEWTHITGTYNNETNETKIYRNGELRSTYSVEGGAQNFLDLDNIGKYNSNYWNGTLDDLKIRNVRLLTTQIEALYNESSRGVYQGKRIPIIYYHNINDTYTDDITVNASNFTDQITWLYNNGFQTITTDNYYEYTQGNYALPEKPIVIQFDDAMYSTYTIAKPLFDSYGFVGSLPIRTNTVGDRTFVQCCSGSSNGTIVPRSTWAEIQEMINDGWEVVSHSENHYNQTTLSYTDRQYQYTQSKSDIESNLTNYIVKHWVYPQNAYNSTDLIECSQYYSTCSGDRAPATNPVYNYKNSPILGYWRIGIVNSTTLDLFKVATNLRDETMLYEYKFNENQGTTAYDTSGNANNGTISGATWNNDGIYTGLTDDVDYTLSESPGTFRIINTELFYSPVNLSYTYSVTSGNIGNITRDLSGGATSYFGFGSTWFTLFAIAILLAIVFTVLKAVQGGTSKFTN